MKLLVVLGKRLNNDGSFHKEMYARCNAAYKLLSDNSYDMAILSGGLANRKAGITEAKAMLDYLISKGIPASKLLLEEQSKTTRQNAKFSAPIIYTFKVDKVYLCSSSSHLTRPFYNPIKLFRCFLRKNGSNVSVIAVPAEI